MRRFHVSGSLSSTAERSRSKLARLCAIAAAVVPRGTITSDTGRIERHIIPLLGTRRVKDLTKTDINKVLKDIMAGKTRVSVKTRKLRGKAVVRGGAGTATRTVGLLGGVLT